jgi:hypothetical protein
MMVSKLVELGLQLVVDETHRQTSKNPGFYRAQEAFHIVKFLFGK